MKTQLKLITIGVGTLCLSGCASLELMAVGGVSYLLTGKGLSDHALSYVMDSDCAFHRLVTEASLCNDIEDIIDSDNAEMMLAEVNADAIPETVALEDESVLLSNSEATAVATTFSTEIQETVEFSTVKLDILDEFTESTDIYAVVGSFNDLQHAFQRSVLYRIYNTHIIENPVGSNTRYRVIVGPLDTRELISQIPVKIGTENQLPWALDLCSDTMMPPPCSNELLARNTAHQ